MARWRTALILLVALLCCWPVEAQNKGKKKGNKGEKGNRDGVDDVVGAIWHYKLTKDGRVVNGTFRVFQHEIFRGAKSIGTVKNKEDGEATFTVPNDSEIGGQASYRLVHTKPPRYRGTLIKANGEKWELELEEKDR